MDVALMQSLVFSEFCQFDSALENHFIFQLNLFFLQV